MFSIIYLVVMLIFNSTQANWQDLTKIQLDEYDYVELSHIKGVSEGKIRSLAKELKEKEAAFVPSFYEAYGKILSLIEEYNCNIICEIGAAFGTHCMAILQETNATR